MAADGAAPDIGSADGKAASPAVASGLSGADSLIGLIVASLEAAGLWSAPGILTALTIHTLTVTALGFWLSRRTQVGGDGSAAGLMLIATAAAGPIGTLGSLIAARLATRGAKRTSIGLLDDWYERISHSVSVDPVSRLCEQVSAGRAIGLSGEPPESFWDVFESGRIEQQQAVLGLIARRFDPRFLPVLARGLTSPSPVVRVQAAAVAARVRHRIEARAAELVGKADDPSLAPDGAIALATELEVYSQSGLVDEPTRLAAAARIDDLIGRHRGIIERELMVAHRGSRRIDPLAADRRDLLERHLVRVGDFAALRRMRSRRRIAALATMARVRPLPTPSRVTVVASGAPR